MEKTLYLQDDGFVVLLPCKFEAWDLNNDGGIQMEEYIFQTRISKNDSNGNLIFDRSDKDGESCLLVETPRENNIILINPSLRQTIITVITSLLRTSEVVRH